MCIALRTELQHDCDVVGLVLTHQKLQETSGIPKLHDLQTADYLQFWLMFLDENAEVLSTAGRNVHSLVDQNSP